MEEETTSVPVRPVNREEGYLHAILVELRKLNAFLGAQQNSGDLLLDDEVKLREKEPGFVDGPRPLPEPDPGQPIQIHG